MKHMSAFRMCVGTGWAIDLHYPDPRFNKDFGGGAFLSIYQPLHYRTPYFMPYRILYSRNIKNLFMAGRDVSVTHEALGTARLMRTGGLMGEVVGLAATLCIQHAIDPHDVYEDHLEEFKALLAKGVPPGLNSQSN